MQERPVKEKETDRRHIRERNRDKKGTEDNKEEEEAIPTPKPRVKMAAKKSKFDPVTTF